MKFMDARMVAAGLFHLGLLDGIRTPADAVMRQVEIQFNASRGPRPIIAEPTFTASELVTFHREVANAYEELVRESAQRRTWWKRGGP